MNTSDHFPLPMPEDEIPPLPLADESGPHACTTIQLYLAILEDLPPAQAQRVLEHASTCSQCGPVLHLMQQSVKVLARLPASAPSQRIDQLVGQAIAERARRGITRKNAESSGRAALQAVELFPIPPGRSTTLDQQQPLRAWRRRRGLVGVGALALAAALVLALLATLHLGGGLAPNAFAIPPNLSWSGYVLFHSETKIDAGGERYQVDTYHDMSTGRMHVETIMPGSMDVVAVGDEHAMLGLDMMHHVAQWGAEDWSADDTDLDLTALRSDLKTGRAVYLGKDSFHGQPVYRIRYRDGLVLLLDMHFRPVNVLRGASGPGTGEAMYNQLELMPDSHVASSMWEMNIPSDFRMGRLPNRP